MNVEDGGRSEPGWHHCTPAQVTEQDSIKREKERETESEREKEREREKKK